MHRHHPTTGQTKSWLFEEPVTSLALTEHNDVLAVVLGSRVILWEPASDRRGKTLFTLPGWPAVRLNDARPDPHGSLWLGSMRNNVNADGSSSDAGGADGLLYRLDPDGTVSEWRREIGISNTMAWNPGRTRFYTADTLANTLSVYDYDLTDGTIRNERSFLNAFERGLPDGSTVDAEGFLWNCRFFGGCIVRVAPDGQTDTVIEMPITNVTTCTFGGPQLNILYVTTASLAAPAAERLAGSLFAIRTGSIKGQPENRFRAFATK